MLVAQVRETTGRMVRHPGTTAAVGAAALAVGGESPEARSNGPLRLPHAKIPFHPGRRLGRRTVPSRRVRVWGGSKQSGKTPPGAAEGPRTSCPEGVLQDGQGGHGCWQTHARQPGRCSQRKMRHEAGPRGCVSQQLYLDGLGLAVLPVLSVLSVVVVVDAALFSRMMCQTLDCMQMSKPAAVLWDAPAARERAAHRSRESPGSPSPLPDHRHLRLTSASHDHRRRFESAASMDGQWTTHISKCHQPRLLGDPSGRPGPSPIRLMRWRVT
ncbi:hypothetical protein BC831DRAFT_252623 [Entophlyctis helioformis]|nr:hypothetical protein BC831DRAFT_252623 [Entophlyctis helioformis]